MKNSLQDLLTRSFDYYYFSLVIRILTHKGNSQDLPQNRLMKAAMVFILWSQMPMFKRMNSPELDWFINEVNYKNPNSGYF